MGHSPEMSERGDTSRSWWRTPLLHRVARLREREDQVFLILALVIGALTGLAVVAFILLTERMGMRLYPVGGAPWRRLLFPVVGSLGIGYLLFRYFPYARGSGVPQTKAALFCPRRPDNAAHRSRKVLLHIGNARQRNPTGARRALRSSWRGHCFSARALLGIAPRKSQGASAGRSGCSNCGGYATETSLATGNGSHAVSSGMHHVANRSE